MPSTPATCKTRFTLGKNLVIEIEAGSVTELMEKAAFFGEVARKVAPTRNVGFFHRTPQGYNFYGLVDLETGEQLPFGQKKEGGFWPKEWERPGATQSRSDSEGPSQGEEPGPDDVPMNYPQGEKRPFKPPTGGGAGAPPPRSSGRF